MYEQVCPSFYINPSNAELNPTCHFLALLGAHHILHVSRVRVNSIFVIESSLLELRTPLIRKLVIRIFNYSDWFTPLVKFVENYTKLTCFEITDYRIK